MKANHTLLKKCLLLLAVLAVPFQSQAQTGRSILNNFLQDWVGPLLIFFLLAGFVVGVIKNYDLITNKQDDGSLVQGFKNVGIIMLYVLFIGVIIIGIVAAANALLDQLKIN